MAGSSLLFLPLSLLILGVCSAFQTSPLALRSHGPRAAIGSASKFVPARTHTGLPSPRLHSALAKEGEGGGKVDEELIMRESGWQWFLVWRHGGGIVEP
eukprot:3549230-Rhodomonas_salina.1